MKPILSINEPDPCIAAYYQVWKRNRDMIEGERAVKPAGACYLPRDVGIDPDQHRNIITRTPFFPGAARTHEGLMGLIFRKPATTTAPDNILRCSKPSPADGYTLDDLAEDVVSELMITNFVGLVTDYPVSPSGISQAKAIDLGLVPQIAIYQAESILGIETAKINNRLRVTRVRLIEDEETIRELRLDDGAYSVTIWKSNGGQWAAHETITPLKNAVPLDEIPFSLVTSARRFLPVKAKMSDVCDINAQHYIASSNLAQADHWASRPTPYLFGVDGADKMSLAPGTFIGGKTKGGDVKIGYLEYQGATMDQLAARVQKLADDMAKVGSRILASEKSAVESADTQMIKAASENAALASTARLASRWINDQLKWVSWWLDLPEDTITYELNTDYGTGQLTSLDLTARFSLYQGGVISKDALLDMLIDGEVLPETFDRELDGQKMSEDVADRPPTGV